MTDGIISDTNNKCIWCNEYLLPYPNLTNIRKEQHQNICGYRKIECPIMKCNQTYRLNGIETHFLDKHPLYYYTENVLNLEIGENDTKTILIKHKHVYFIVNYATNSEYFSISIQKIGFCDDSDAFSISFESEIQLSGKNKISSFEKERFEFGSADFQVKKLCLMEILKINLYSPIEFKLKINEPTNPVEIIFKQLECPICDKYMNSHIYLCKNGHSLCDDCVHRVNKCPYCKDIYLGTRNFSLETMYSELNKLFPKLFNNNNKENGSYNPNEEDTSDFSESPQSAQYDSF